MKKVAPPLIKLVSFGEASEAVAQQNGKKVGAGWGLINVFICLETYQPHIKAFITVAKLETAARHGA